MEINTRSGRYLAGVIVASLLGLMALVVPMQTVQAGGDPLVTESFANSTVGSSFWETGGTAFAPCLTASTNTSESPIPGCGTGKVGLPTGGDPVGDGALRLTDNLGDESGFILYNEPLPTQAGLVVSFDQYQYDGDGADGISFFLTNGAYNLTAPGAVGGYLGYAGGDHSIGNANGVANGLFGVGLDAYGNFSNFENTGCTYPGIPDVTPNQIGVRGPGNGETGYCWLGGTGALSTPLNVNSASSRAAAGVMVAVQIIVDAPADSDPEIHVSVNGTNVLNVPEPTDLPPTFKFGFAASSGGSNNIHEINNLQVSTAAALTPSWDLSGSTSGAFTAGSAVNYIFTATPDSSWGSGVDPVSFTDTLEDGSTVASLPSGTGWNCSATVVGSTTASCTYTISGSQTPGVPLPTLTVPVQLTTASGTVVNSATVTSADNYPADTSNSVTLTNTVAPATTGVSATIPLNTIYQEAVPAPVGSGPFTYSLTSSPPSSFGTASINSSSGVLTFTPLTNVSGVVPTFDYQVVDAGGNPSAATPVSITVTPIASALGIVGDGPGPLTATPTPALGSAPFTYALVAGSLPPTSYGTAAINSATGAVTFTPASGFLGTVPTFDYIATDKYGAVSPGAPVNVTIEEPPGPGGLNNLALTTNVNTPVAATPTTTSGAPPLTWSLLDLPPSSYGTATINSATGKITFTPAANFSGTVPVFQYQAADQYGQTDFANVSVVVLPTTSALGVTGNAPGALNTGAPTTVGSAPFTYKLVTTPPPFTGTASINVSTGVVTFTPAFGFSGTVPTFYYTATDSYGVPSTQAPVNVLVTKPAAPTANNVSASTNVDEPVLAAVDVTSGTDPLNFSLSSIPSSSWGTAVINPSTGILTFVPAVGVSGNVPEFDATVTDQWGQAATVTVNIAIHPLITPITASGTGPSPIQVLPAPPQGTGPFTYALLDTPPTSVGTTSINPVTGEITFTPATGFTGAVPTFEYLVADSSGVLSNLAPVNLTVTKPAGPSGLANLNLSTVANSPVSVMPTDPNGAPPFSWQLLDAPGSAYGAALINPSTGEITFTPATNFSGTVPEFQYQATDQYGQTDFADVNVVVHPITNALAASGNGPTPVQTSTAATVGSSPFTYELVTTPPASDGIATIDSSTDEVTFWPAFGFFGAVPTFYYAATDEYGGESSPAPVNVVVTEPPAPTANDLSLSTSVGDTVVGAVHVTSGSEPFTFSLSSAPPSAWGTATIDAITGVVTFVPVAGVSGAVPPFDADVSDQYGQTAIVTVTVDIQPVVTAIAGSGTGPAPIEVTPPTPLGTGPFTYSLVGIPPSSVGTVTVDSATGEITFTPAAGFSGVVPTFDYQVTDASGVVSDPAAVNLTVNLPVAPTANAVDATTTAGMPVTTAVPVVHATPPLSWTLLSNPPVGDGLASINSVTGAITFTPTAGFSGIVPAFDYQVTDQYSRNASAPVEISVDPVANPVSGSGVAPNPLTVTPPTPTGVGPFTFSLVTAALPPAADGTATINTSTGAITFTPASGFSGVVPGFSYMATDGDGLSSAPATVNLSFALPGAPIVSNVSRSTPLNTTLTFALPTPEGVGPFTWSLLSGPPASEGTAQLSPGDGLVTFTPARNWSGYVPSFSYQVENPYAVVSNRGAIAIEVTPSAFDISATTTVGDGPLDLQPPPPAGTGPFTYALVGSSLPPAGVGTVTINPSTGQITFTPAPGVSGVVPSFRYSVVDASGAVASASVNITVLPRAFSGDSAIKSGKRQYQLPLPKAEGSGPFVCSLMSSSLPSKNVGTVGLNPKTCVVTFEPGPDAANAAFTIRYTVTDRYGLVSAPATHSVRIVNASQDSRHVAAAHCSCGFWWVPFFVAGVLVGWAAMIYWLRRRYPDEPEESA
jgi:CshA-type fibril repeat protein